MKESTISIIIPIYNTCEDKLKQCVKSIVDSIVEKYEILLVDDGSKEYIKEICLKLCKEYHSIKYIRKQNGGVSSARNRGIEESIGSHIMFVDSDDTVDLGKIDISHCQDGMVVYDMLCVYNGKQSIWKTFKYNEETDIPLEEVLRTLIFSHNMNSPCGKIYSKKIIDDNGIKFDESMITGEDLCFVCKYLMSSDFKVVYSPISVYCYYRENSSRNARIKKYPDVMIENSKHCYEVLNNILEKSEIDDTIKKEFKTKLISAEVESMFNYQTDMICLHSLTRERKERIRQIVISKGKLNKNVALKQKVKGFLIQNDLSGIIVVLAWMRALYLKIK